MKIPRFFVMGILICPWSQLLNSLRLHFGLKSGDAMERRAKRPKCQTQRPTGVAIARSDTGMATTFLKIRIRLIGLKWLFEHAICFQLRPRQLRKGHQLPLM